MYLRQLIHPIVQQVNDTCTLAAVGKTLSRTESKVMETQYFGSKNMSNCFYSTVPFAKAIFISSALLIAEVGIGQANLVLQYANRKNVNLILLQ
jgi:hypothetical protein